MEKYNEKDIDKAILAMKHGRIVHQSKADEAVSDIHRRMSEELVQCYECAVYALEQLRGAK